ncbi:MAG: hypothetical protein CVU38_20685, partial [Chloroflexi bacterium HGW-Chloroflexi-1]
FLSFVQAVAVEILPGHPGDGPGVWGQGGGWGGIRGRSQAHAARRGEVRSGRQAEHAQREPQQHQRQTPTPPMLRGCVRPKPPRSGSLRGGKSGHACPSIGCP